MARLHSEDAASTRFAGLRVLSPRSFSVLRSGTSWRLRRIDVPFMAWSRKITAETCSVFRNHAHTINDAARGKEVSGLGRGPSAAVRTAGAAGRVLGTGVSLFRPGLLDLPAGCPRRRRGRGRHAGRVPAAGAQSADLRCGDFAGRLAVPDRPAGVPERGSAGDARSAPRTKAGAAHGRRRDKECRGE